MRRALAFVLFAPLGCGVLLDDVLHTVTPDRAAECADRPTDEARAKCVGVDVLSDGLRLALRRAGELALAAIRARSGAGAEMSPADERKLARELDHALDELAHEIAAAG